jgi:hypothetical protein
MCLDVADNIPNEVILIALEDEHVAYSRVRES